MWEDDVKHLKVGKRLVDEVRSERSMACSTCSIVDQIDNAILDNSSTSLNELK